jgi:hypothetical protein
LTSLDNIISSLTCHISPVKAKAAVSSGNPPGGVPVPTTILVHELCALKTTLFLLMQEQLVHADSQICLTPWAAMLLSSASTGYRNAPSLRPTSTTAKEILLSPMNTAPS